MGCSNAGTTINDKGGKQVWRIKKEVNQTTGEVINYKYNSYFYNCYADIFIGCGNCYIFWE